MRNSMKTVGLVAFLFVLLAASRATAATPIRMFEVGERVDEQVFSKATWQKYVLKYYASNPPPPGLTFGANAAGGFALQGTPTTAGTYLTKGYAEDRQTKQKYPWEIKFLITPHYTQTTGTFSLTEVAKEDRSGTVKGTTKITATINMQGQTLSPSDQLTFEAGDGFSFETDLSEAGFDGKKALFYTEDGGKVALKFNRGILTITVTQAFNDSGDDANVAATDGVVATEMIGEDTSLESDSFEVTITVGLMQATMDIGYTASIKTKTYDVDDTETSSVTVKAKGGN